MTKLEKAIEKFIKEIDEELNVSFIKGIGSSFEAETNTVNIDFSETEEYGFLRHLKEVHKCKFAYDYPLILWAILHEIGHYETEWELLEDDDDTEIRNWLSFTDKSFANDIVIQDMYFNLNAEWYATEWAIEWIKNNKEIAEKFKV